MGYRSIQRTAVAALLFVAAAGTLVAQGVTLSANPSSLTFNIALGQPPAQDITISSSSGQAVGVSITPGTGVVIQQVVSAPNGQSFTPQTLRITVTPSALAGTAQTSLNVASLNSGVAGFAVPITITGSGTGGGTFNVTPGSLSFSQSGTTVPSAQTLSVTGAFASSPPAYTISIVYLSGSGLAHDITGPIPDDDVVVRDRHTCQFSFDDGHLSSHDPAAVHRRYYRHSCYPVREPGRHHTAHGIPEFVVVLIPAGHHHVAVACVECQFPDG